MDTSHCGKLTSTPWRPSDARVRIYAHAHARPSRTSPCDFQAESSHTHTHVPPTRDKHERVYVGSLPRKRNEMKRPPFYRATAGPAASLLLPQLPSTRFHSFSRAYPRACVAGPTNKWRSAERRVCSHVCEHALRFVANVSSAYAFYGCTGCFITLNLSDKLVRSSLLLANATGSRKMFDVNAKGKGLKLSGHGRFLFAHSSRIQFGIMNNWVIEFYFKYIQRQTSSATSFL